MSRTVRAFSFATAVAATTAYLPGAAASPPTARFPDGTSAPTSPPPPATPLPDAASAPVERAYDTPPTAAVEPFVAPRPFDEPTSTAAPAPDASPSTTAPSTTPETESFSLDPEPASSDVRDDGSDEETSKIDRDAWMFSLEGVTNFPVDIGARATFETPFRLRLSAGYGAVPDGYAGVVDRVVSATGATNPFVQDALTASFQRGRSLRLQVGLRPFASAGFYVDFGYSRVDLEGRLDDTTVSPQSLGIDAAANGRAFALRSRIRSWIAEIGWQGQIGRRVVLGVGFGVIGVVDADSTARANFSEANDPTVRQVTEESVRTFDETLERYGYVPTLTLRLGYDLI